MNVNSTSSAESSKASAVSKTPGGQPVAEDTNAESGSFLSKLSSLLFGSAPSEESDAAPAKGPVTEGSKAAQAAVALSETEAEADSASSPRPPAAQSQGSDISEALKPFIAEDDEDTASSAASRTAQAMSDGDALLGRLQKANQALSQHHGKSLPHDALNTPLSTQSSVNESPHSVNMGAATPQDEMHITQSDLPTPQGKMSTTQSDLARPQGEMSTTQSDLARPQGEMSTTQSDLTRPQGEMSTTQSDLTRPQAETDADQVLSATPQVPATRILAQATPSATAVPAESGLARPAAQPTSAAANPLWRYAAQPSAESAQPLPAGAGQTPVSASPASVGDLAADPTSVITQSAATQWVEGLAASGVQPENRPLTMAELPNELNVAASDLPGTAAVQYGQLKSAMEPGGQFGEVKSTDLTDEELAAWLATQPVAAPDMPAASVNDMATLSASSDEANAMPWAQVNAQPMQAGLSAEELAMQTPERGVVKPAMPAHMSGAAQQVSTATQQQALNLLQSSQQAAAQVLPAGTDAANPAQNLAQTTVPLNPAAAQFNPMLAAEMMSKAEAFNAAGLNLQPGGNKAPGGIDELRTAHGSDGQFAHQVAAAAGQSGVNGLQTLRPEQAQPQLSVPLQLSKEMSADDMAERVQMMMSKNLKQIDIRLDPPELGRLHIRMNVHGDGTNVQFTVSNPQARDAIEHSMPRLREMLAQQGVQLADTSVQQQNAGQQQRYSAGGGGQNGQSTGNERFGGEENLDADVKLDLNVASKRDGISYYA